MLPIRYMKATPTTYVLQFKNGRVRREGPGLSFFYYAPTTTLVTVPLRVPMSLSPSRRQRQISRLWPFKAN